MKGREESGEKVGSVKEKERKERGGMKREGGERRWKRVS